MMIERNTCATCIGNDVQHVQNPTKTVLCCPKDQPALTYTAAFEIQNEMAEVARCALTPPTSVIFESFSPYLELLNYT